MENPPAIPPDVPMQCARCGRMLVQEARFCNGCGVPTPRSTAFVAEDRAFSRRQRDFVAAFILVLCYILGSHFVEVGSGWHRALFWDLGFLGLVVVASAYFWKVLRPALSWRPFRWDRLGLYMGLQFVLTALVIVSMELLRRTFGLEDGSVFEGYADAPVPLLFALLSVAVAPALTEETLFRGILFGQLATLTGALNTILVTGFLFALLHFSFLSMFWLVAAGAFYGWVRHREGIIWYGVIGHFLHNAATVVGAYQGWW